VRLTQIRDFVAVVETGSIGAAARSFGVSQPGITKSIRALETELQVQLLQRTTRGVVPTPYGKAFYARARVAQSELQHAEQEIQHLAGDRTGSVAFGFGPVAAALIVPEAVSIFREKFPSARVRLVEGFVHTMVPLVRDETLDFAIAPGIAEFRRDPGLKFRPLFHYERVVAGRRNHPLARAGSLARLIEAQWLSFEPRGMLEQMFLKLGLSCPRPIVQSDSGSASLMLLARTDMLGVLPRPMLSATNADLHEFRIAEVFPPFTVGIFTRADTPLTRASSAMARIVSEVGRRVASDRPAA